MVPVHNEQPTLVESIRRLHEFLRAELPFTLRIVIVDNASTDSTPALGRFLAQDLPGVAFLRLEEKGRGRALRAAWSQSDADVVCYMDVDLSTDLRALLPLIAPIVSGHSDLAIGTRLRHDSRVVRGPKRELISRAYNALLRVTLRARFTDAQCGFKAVRGDLARQLLPTIRDDGWFFDTELLTIAQREGLRIHEVAVDWVEDQDSRVDIFRTAVDDLRGVARLMAATRLFRFIVVGTCSTLAYALLYLALRGPLGVAGANALALALTAVANTQANRNYTFGVRGRPGLVRQHALGGLVYLLTLGLSSGAIDLLRAVDPQPGRGLEVAVLVTAGIGATLTRYAALKAWVFTRRAQEPSLARSLAMSSSASPLASSQSAGPP
jgi:putative flippase GtrA